MPVNPNSSGSPQARWFVLEPAAEKGPTMHYYEPNGRNGVHKGEVVLSTERGQLKPVIDGWVVYNAGTSSMKEYPTLAFEATRSKKKMSK